jgi:hypothetical protein
MISANFGLDGEGSGHGGLGEILFAGRVSGSLSDIVGGLTFFNDTLPPSDYGITGGAGGAGGGSGGSPGESAIPEPSAIVLVGGGLIMLLGLRSPFLHERKPSSKRTHS